MNKKTLGIIVVACLILGGSFFYKEMAVDRNKDEGSVPIITVYRNSQCQCCKKWIHHLEENHFEVKDEIVTNLKDIKNKFRIPKHLSACHTALIGSYVIEGHVPAQDIYDLLKKKSDIKGLAVPGMPVGSPGMERGTRKVPFDIIAFKKNGKTFVFRHDGTSKLK